MTVLTPTEKISGLGNGAATVFSFSPIVIFKSSELVVTHVDASGVETLLVEGTGATKYKVTVASFPGTGSITYPEDAVTPIPTGEKVVMKRVLVLEQQTDLENQGGYFADVQETMADKAAMRTIQQQEEIDRSLKLKVGDTTVTSVELPPPAALKTFRWNAAGTALEEANDPGAAETAAAASAAAALASETAAAASETAAAASATAASASASAASVSETAAALSETNAATSEAAAAASASAALASEAAAAASASAASASETAAAASASAAAASETAAAASATAAAISETNAATSETNAATSATNAATSATNAATSETNAATSETNAATSKTDAEAAAGAVAYKWLFDSSVSMGDPGTGDIRLNHATPASVTQIAVSALTADTGNPDVSAFIVTWDDSDHTPRGTIIIRLSGTPATFVIYSVNGAITDNGIWLQIPVAHVAGNGSLANTDKLFIHFLRSGDDGAGTGDMLAANNLSDVADVPTARVNLGLGTAAVENVGVADGDVPQMDAVGYPAADGSQITGIAAGPSQATQAALEAETNEDTYAPPDLLKHGPWAFKSWGYVTYSGGVPTLQVSYNITSISDDGVGNLGVTLANDHSSVNYAVFGSAARDTGGQFNMYEHKADRAVGAYTVLIDNTGGSLSDPFAVSFGSTGDL